MNYLIFIPKSRFVRTKNKNLKFLKGKPLISYTLETANNNSKKIKADIFLSTIVKKFLITVKKRQKLLIILDQSI